MRLKSFGCSFIWGTELPDEATGPTSEKNIPSNLTWPALVAKELNYKYQCFAWPGYGNLAIANNILRHCVAARQGDFFVVSWSFIDRFDHADKNGSTKWATIRPGNGDEISNFYYKNLHSESVDKLTSLIYIKTCIDILEQKKIPFIMTCIDKLLFDNQWHAPEEILMLQALVLPHFVMFEGKDFLSYTKALGHSLTKNGHVDKHAHSDAAKYVVNFLRTQRMFPDQC